MQLISQENNSVHYVEFHVIMSREFITTWETTIR